MTPAPRPFRPGVPPGRFLHAEGNSRPLNPLERMLLCVTALHLCFLPWALGGMHVWSQFASLGLSIVGLALALWRRTNGLGVADRRPLSRLLRFPVFWAGLALLGYVAVQGANPSWRFATDGRSWWLTPVAHAAWLPSGVEGPFARSNPWRALAVYGSLWLLICSVWCGLLRRQSYRLLFGILVANGFALSVLGLLQRLTDAREIFWFYPPANGNFAASFIYRNHAGAFFNLVAALATGLAWWHGKRARRRLEGPGKSILFTFAALWMGTMVIFTYSRASVVLLLVFTALMGAAFGYRLCRQEGPVGSRAAFAALALALASIVGIVLVSVRTEKLWRRFADLAADPAASVLDRSTVREAAGSMRRDRWALGWGAGCFRYGFPLYAQSYPNIYLSPSGTLRYWEHAHDDLLEFPLELGAVGMLPITAVFAWGAYRLFLLRFWRHPVSLSVVLGCSLLVLHAWVDFVFQSPAVLFTWTILLAGSARWLELEGTVAGVIPKRACIPARPASWPP